MRCPICNHETADDSNFCGNCGAKLSRYKKAEETTPKQVEQPTVESVDAASADQKTQSEKTALNDNPISFNSDDQLPKAQSEQSGNTGPNVQQPDFSVAFAPKKKSKVPVIAIIAVILVVAVGALYFSGVFDAGPLASIAKAIDKTAKAESFDVNLEITFQDETMTMEGTVLFDPAAENVEFYFKVDLPGTKEPIVFLLRNNILINDDGYVDSLDISKYLDIFWEDYKTSDKSDVEWSDLLKLAGLDSDDVDFDKFEAAADDFLKNLNDTDYIDQKLGAFEKTTANGITNYNFVFKCKDLSEELINVFGEAFMLDDEDRADIEDDVYEWLKETVGNKLELNYKVKSGYLTGFSFLADEIEIEVELSDFGKAEIAESKFKKYERYLKEASRD